MKRKSFGDVVKLDSYNGIQYNKNKFNDRGVEFHTPDDRTSARAWNRPIRQLHEDFEANYEILQYICKFLIGDKSTGIIPDLYEEFSPENFKVGSYFNNKFEKYLRIPTGAIFINNVNRKKETTVQVDDLKSKYGIFEEKDYLKSKYISRDGNSAIIINRPNLEVYERELADHFNVDLNEQFNNLKLDYTITDDKKINYILEIARTIYDYNDHEIVDKTWQLKNTETNSYIFDNVFDMTSETAAQNNINRISTFVEKDGLFTLEETIPLFNKITASTYSYLGEEKHDRKYILFYRMGDYHENPEHSTINYQYSLSGNYGLAKENVALFDTDLPLFSMTVKYDQATGSGVSNVESLIGKIDRGTLEQKNLSVTNNFITVDKVAWHIDHNDNFLADLM